MVGRIAVIGSGYVGGVVAAGFALVGHDVTVVERERARLAQLRSGVAPFREPGLDPLLASGLASGRLRFTDELGSGLEGVDVVFVCVGTPPGADGRPDMSAMATVADGLSAHLSAHQIVVTKSTVPIGTGRWLRAQIEENRGADGPGRWPVRVVSNPEFLREGHAVEDFLHPDRIVLGSDDAAALQRVVELYEPITAQAIPGDNSQRGPVPLLLTDLATAEMTKYASNAFLAMKISFANEIAHLCELVGADVGAVVDGVGLDVRIGRPFLDAGLGWGGSCLGKDLSALVGTAVEFGYHPALLEAALQVNEHQRQLVVDELLHQLRSLRGARIAVLGLAFKPGTDDVRDAPGVDVAGRLAGRGAFVAVYDPLVTSLDSLDGVRFADDPYAAARGAEAVVLATDWPELAALDLYELARAMRGDLLFDGRNLFDPAKVRAAGLRYLGVGRPAVGVERPSPLPLMPLATTQ